MSGKIASVNVTGLRVYPVKSHGGQSVDEAVVERQGLAGDRRWCLVDGAGQARLHEWIDQERDHPTSTEPDAEALSGSSPAPAEPLDAVCFRSNVVINGEEPFAEDCWGRVQLAGVDWNSRTRRRLEVT